MLHSIFYCEHCPEQLETAAAVDIPPHWIELLDGSHPDRPLHFCCWHCVAAYADGRHSPTFTFPTHHPHP